MQRRVFRMIGALGREPVVHVVVLGLLVFAAHRLLAPPDAGRLIVVGQGVRDGLRLDHERRTGVPPTPAEEAAALERWLDDEIRYREALRLGLDRGDVIVRRRLIQKMEFLTEDLDPPREPTEAELEAHWTLSRERWIEPARVTLEHVFASRTRHGAAASAVAMAWREQLDAGGDPAALGDPFLRGRQFVGHSEAQLAAIFGPGFAAAVMGLAADGRWAGPVPSSYGEHLVRVHGRQEARQRTLGEVRDEVRREWLERERERLDREARARLRARYAIRIEGASEGAVAQAAERP